jgi:hypothetical protein
VCTRASVLVPIGSSHRSQREDGLREPSLGLPARMMGEVKFPFLGQRESVTAGDKVTLEDQIFSMSKFRTLLGREGWLPGGRWAEG